MMDDAEEDVRYNSDAMGEDAELQAAEGYERVKGSERDRTYGNNQYGEGEEDNDKDDVLEVVEEDEDDDAGDGDFIGVQRIGNSELNDVHEMDGAEEENEKSGYRRRIEDIVFERQPKKRRLKKNLVSNYEFAPRIAQTLALTQPVADTDDVTIASTYASTAPATNNKHSFGGQNALSDWTEQETFVLLDAWGDRFLQHGRTSLRSEEWKEVAEKVSQEWRIERTETQCRNRLDTLNKKFKEEKSKFMPAAGQSSRWIYFKKMEMLMSPPLNQSDLLRGVDSGENVFSNPRAYMSCTNGLDEMRDSAGDSDSTEDDSDGLPPRRKVPTRFIKNSTHAQEEKDRRPMKLLADSLNNFCKIYEKNENSLRQKLVELEKMRTDFHRDLEQEMKLIVERAQAEIAKIWQGDNEENGGASGENISS